MAHFPPVTRESIPRFDLYAELEVSRLARAEVIEAAYRTLAKIHHPDVAPEDDGDRIKRLNQAHDWLTDPIKRRRYDNATKAGTAAAAPPPTWPAQDAAAGTDRSGRASSSKAFGVNTAEVREFLADLRSLDEQQAAEVHAGKAATDQMAFAVAQHVAATAGQTHRQAEWLLAREAASVIVRGKLRNSNLQAEVAAIVADIAGAIAIRDLIPKTDFEVLLQPWGWRDEEGALTTASASTALVPRGTSPKGVVQRGVASRGVAPVGTPPRVTAGRTSRSLLTGPRAVLAMIGVVALVGATVALTGPKPSTADARTSDTPSLAAFSSFADGASAAASAAPTSIEPTSSGATPVPSDGSTPAPTPTLAPGVTSGPTPRTTPRPTPAPTPQPTPVPTPIPTPTPVPTPSPQVFCTVPDFSNQSTGAAPGLWTGAFFTGTITYSPTVPPQYKIGWQSLPALSSVLCTSNITLQQVAPTPSP